MVRSEIEDFLYEFQLDSISIFLGRNNSAFVAQNYHLKMGINV